MRATKWFVDISAGDRRRVYADKDNVLYYLTLSGKPIRLRDDIEVVEPLLVHRVRNQLNQKRYG